MFLSIKKKSIIAGLAILVTAVGLCFAVSGVAGAAYNVPAVGKTVVIDAGHGGADGGVTGVATSVKESDVNLAIARNLKHFLKTRGYEVIMTRSTTDGLYGMSTKNKKQKDMAARKEIITQSGADLVISIHCNSYPRESVKGAQVFFAPGSEDGNAKADVMQSVLNSSLDCNRTAMKGDYFILQCSQIPSLLVECGFLSNREEEKLLVSASYQEKVAFAIFTGAVTILGE